MFEHLARVGERRLARVAREHACDLRHARLSRDLVDLGLGRLARGERHLMHQVVTVCHDGDLSQVRDNNDLVRAAKVAQHLRECHGRGPAHTGIHLVKDERVTTVCISQRHLAGKHHAAYLAARCDAPERSRGEAGSRPVEELHAAWPHAPPLVAWQSRLRDGKRRRAHL